MATPEQIEQARQWLPDPDTYPYPVYTAMVPSATQDLLLIDSPKAPSPTDVPSERVLFERVEYACGPHRFAVWRAPGEPDLTTREIRQRAARF